MIMFKPRRTTLVFETEEEYRRFMDYAMGRIDPNPEGRRRMEELLKMELPIVDYDEWPKDWPLPTAWTDDK